MNAAASQTCSLKHKGNDNTEDPQSAAETATPTKTPRNPCQSKISSYPGHPASRSTLPTRLMNAGTDLYST